MIGLGILFYIDSWWPGILLVICAWLGVRQYLTGRRFDMVITTILLVGLFFITFFKINWKYIIPTLFFLGAVYVIVREFFQPDDHDEGKIN